jgi:hypothetical protein
MDSSQIANSFKIRCSAILEIVGGEIGLTERQQSKLTELQTRTKPLTDNMKAELAVLLRKKANPELPEGAKTHCDKWLKEFVWKRRPEIKSKYITKGNLNEEDGFTVMAVELGLGMVYKNTQYHSNEYIHGTDDLFVKGIVYDNKCSWDLSTFPMYAKEIPDVKYEWQLNGYCELRNVDDAVLAYTLIDAPQELIEREIKWLTDHNEIYKKVCNMVYTADYFNHLRDNFFADATYNYFVEIPQSKRIKPFNIKRDPLKINKTIERVKMCRSYILKELLS